MTELKRACCMIPNNVQNDYSIDISVRRPLLKSDKINTGTATADIYKKYNFYDTYPPSTITKATCNALLPEYTQGNAKCNNFYMTYCDNIKDEFNNASGSTDSNFDYINFNNYKPECACYSPKPSWLSGFNVPPKCYLHGCTE